jgi:hypothetical protein
MTPNEFAHELEHIYGEKLQSVVLYGPELRNNRSKKSAGYNVFCILEEPTTTALAKANKVIKKWCKKGNPAPHFFDPTHIETSLDVFPLDFLDIQDAHEVLMGSDPVKGIVVDQKNIRHQCESELKGKLIHLRTFFAANCDKPKLVAKTMVESFSTIMTAFRGTLRLLGETPPSGDDAIIEKLSELIDLNPQVFLDILDIRNGSSLLPRKSDALEMFERYLTEIETITNFVDGLEA